MRSFAIVFVLLSLVFLLGECRSTVRCNTNIQMSAKEIYHTIKSTLISIQLKVKTAILTVVKKSKLFSLWKDYPQKKQLLKTDNRINQLPSVRRIKKKNHLFSQIQVTDHVITGRNPLLLSIRPVEKKNHLIRKISDKDQQLPCDHVQENKKILEKKIQTDDENRQVPSILTEQIPYFFMKQILVSELLGNNKTEELRSIQTELDNRTSNFPSPRWKSKRYNSIQQKMNSEIIIEIKKTNLVFPRGEARNHLPKNHIADSEHPFYNKNVQFLSIRAVAKGHHSIKRKGKPISENKEKHFEKYRTIRSIKKGNLRIPRDIAFGMEQLANQEWELNYTTLAPEVVNGSNLIHTFEVISQEEILRAKHLYIKKILLYVGITLAAVLAFTVIGIFFITDPKSCILAFATGCPCCLIISPCCVSGLAQFLNPGQVVRDQMNTYLPGMIIDRDGNIELYEITPGEMEAVQVLITDVIDFAQ